MFERIVRVPGILCGKPTIRGTRISVEFVMELVESGGTPELIVERYPHLTLEDINQAIQFAQAGNDLRP